MFDERSQSGASADLDTEVSRTTAIRARCRNAASGMLAGMSSSSKSLVERKSSLIRAEICRENLYFQCQFQCNSGRNTHVPSVPLLLTRAYHDVRLREASTIADFRSISAHTSPCRHSSMFNILKCIHWKQNAQRLVCSEALEISEPNNRHHSATLQK